MYGHVVITVKDDIVAETTPRINVEISVFLKNAYMQKWLVVKKKHIK